METQLVVFTLAEESFGVPIEQVREINRLVPITAVPKAPAGILGVINLRGKVIPVVSLRERFGFDERTQDDQTRIVIGDVAGRTTGFVVDAVTEVLRLDGETIEPPPAGVAGVDSSFIKGIGKVEDRLIIVLDLERVVDCGELAQLAAGA